MEERDEARTVSVRWGGGVGEQESKEWGEGNSHETKRLHTRLTGATLS